MTDEAKELKEKYPHLIEEIIQYMNDLPAMQLQRDIKTLADELPKIADVVGRISKLRLEAREQMIRAELIHSQQRKPVFKTVDGVDIFGGESIYFVGENWGIISLSQVGPEYKGWPKDGSVAPNTFSTKEKAEEYVLWNKPCLSLKDIANEPSIRQYPYLNTWVVQKLLPIVKSKL